MADETIEISFDATLINLIQWLTDDLLRAKWRQLGITLNQVYLLYSKL